MGGQIILYLNWYLHLFYLWNKKRRRKPSSYLTFGITFGYKGNLCHLFFYCMWKSYVYMMYHLKLQVIKYNVCSPKVQAIVVCQLPGSSFPHEAAFKLQNTIWGSCHYVLLCHCPHGYLGNHHFTHHVK